MLSSLPQLFSIVLSATWVTAHPGADYAKEAAAHKSFLSHTAKRYLSHCAEHFQASGLRARQVARRDEVTRSLRNSQSLNTRDLSAINESHHAEEHYTVWTPPEVLFASNNSCVLSPETIEGPYYVAGEYVRKDLTDGEPGVPLFVEIQVIDIDTCEPIPNIYSEIWSCNATGVYSGVSVAGNGNVNDTSNFNNTFLRGLQPTDHDGTSLYQTIFPGHYAGRTTHIHTIAHLNATILPNGTVMNTVASHVGQMSLDQDLIDQVEALYPYTENTQALTLNADDFILPTAANASDPLMEWVYLGDHISDGILAWLAFGVNQSSVKNVSASALYFESGGEKNDAVSFPSA